MHDNDTAVNHWVIIPAAGVGSRMSADKPKQYLTVLGKALIEHTLDSFTSHPLFKTIYVGIAEDDPYWSGFSCASASAIKSFVGGNERAHTVLNGLKCLERVAQPNDWVWIHDAARPCLTKEDIEALCLALKADAPDGALLALPIYDTIKRANSLGAVDTTIDRSQIWRAQTPQVFRVGKIRSALESCLENSLEVTDESSAIEHMGGHPILVSGDVNNIKVTRPQDLETVMAQLNKTTNSLRPRIGSGFDVHAFDKGACIVLGGVSIPYSQGLKAHSDGDVLLHALCDALLGALALGDIGKHFPDTDAKWKGADSRTLLRAVFGKVKDRNYCVGNVDVTIMAEAPKMAPHIGSMCSNIAQDLGLEMGMVSVKATTTEQLGFTGRGEGIACQATVLLFEAQTL